MSFKGFLEAKNAGSLGEAAILGIPFDGVATFRSGSKNGPKAIREASYSLETFSAFQDSDLLGRDYLDCGDLDIATDVVEEMILVTSLEVEKIVQNQMKPVILGGEHAVSLGVIQTLLQEHAGLAILQLDAHAGYRDEYLGQRFCHGTVMRRISELVSPEKIFRVGIRSGTREEFIRANIKLPIEFDESIHDMNTIIRYIPQDVPLYVTMDMDVFDPSLVPAVRNPEPMGLTWREFVHLARALAFRRTIGFDIVGLTPEYDPTGISAIVAASAVRELLLSIL